MQRVCDWIDKVLSSLLYVCKSVRFENVLWQEIMQLLDERCVFTSFQQRNALVSIDIEPIGGGVVAEAAGCHDMEIQRGKVAVPDVSMPCLSPDYHPSSIVAMHIIEHITMGMRCRD